MVQIPGLKQSVRKGWYQVRIAGRDVCEADLAQRMNAPLPDSAVVHIVPRMCGAKGGSFIQVVLGTAMIALAAFAPWGAAIWASNLMFQVGAAMVLGGVVQWLTPVPRTPSNATTDNGKNSTQFSSLDNRVAQGCCVPVAYGLIMTGSRVISEEVSSWDDATGSTVVLGAGD